MSMSRLDFYDLRYESSLRSRLSSVIMEMLGQKLRRFSGMNLVDA